MAPFKDLVRIVNGVSLVAAEAAKRSQPLAAARTGDFETLIYKTLKNALVSVTDLAGFTKGRIREVSTPRGKESVVYFTDHPEPEPAERRPDPIESRVPEVPVVVEEAGELRAGSELGDLGGKSEEKVVNLVGKNDKEEGETLKVVSLGEEKEKGVDEVVAAAAAPVKRRQRRERRVPSTPFGRALG